MVTILSSLVSCSGSWLPLTSAASSFVRAKSECDGIAVDAVVRCAKGVLDNFKPAGLAQRPPSPQCRPRDLDAGDLPYGAVFDGRTGAKAISHGKSPFLLMATGGAGCWGGIYPRRRLDVEICFLYSFRQSNARRKR
jgi:hypothetical protein